MHDSGLNIDNHCSASSIINAGMLSRKLVTLSVWIREACLELEDTFPADESALKQADESDRRLKNFKASPRADARPTTGRTSSTGRKRRTNGRRRRRKVENCRFARGILRRASDSVPRGAQADLSLLTLRSCPRTSPSRCIISSRLASEEPCSLESSIR